ncbi:MAG: hypothetical protein CVV44_15090 [Spirochaetae bacterium HGW-Spirochaetae-1]|jgi:hypothetical protein|nr:MAG: hypothetical protein CVV44_15090 [Spirochaetae bacterium HGW-Spirochaetae-1]
MPEKAKKSTRQVSFSDYKALKDEIIEISEQRFENILTKRLKENNRKLIDEIFARLEPRFDAIDAKFNAIDSRFGAVDAKFAANDTKFAAIDIRFDSLEKRMTFMTWFIPIVITLVMTVLKVF